MPLCRFICSAFLCIGAVISASATAQLLTLHSHARDTTPVKLAEHLSAYAKKQDVRQIVIETTLFQQNEWQKNLSLIELQLDDDTTLTLLPKQHSIKNDHVIWQGYIVGEPNSIAAMVISPKGISGSVRHKGRLWQIRRLADGQMIMFETEQSLLKADDTVRLTEEQQHQPSASASSASYTQLLPEVSTSANGFTDEPRVQVMVYYDVQELETYPDLLELIDLEFLQANNALTNSGIDAQLNAVAKLPVSRQNASRGMLSLMLSGEEMFSNLARDRQRYKADLVHYFGLNLDNWGCGLAYSSAYPEGSANAYLGLGATNTSCMGNLVFAHEVGHNFGAEHDRHVVPDADADFNYGYVDLEMSIKTIMAYPNLCDEDYKDCETLPYFSNPTLEHQGKPLGIAAGEPDAADNQKMLNFSALTLANYAGVGAPTGLTASNNNLLQGINVSWQPLTGATAYELYRSTSCDYDNFKTLVVTTIDTSYADVDASGGRYCYFVQGINDNLINGAQRSPLSLPESGFGSGPALSKIADQLTDGVDQSIAVTFSSGALVAPSIEIVQHNLPSEPLLFLQDLGSNQFQLTVSNTTNTDGTAIVKVSTYRVFEVFSVSFRGNANTAPVIAAPETVTFNQQSNTSFTVDIFDKEVNPTNPIGLLVQSEDERLLPKAAIEQKLVYTENGAELTIDINPRHKLFGTTALNISITDGEHVVSQRVEVDIIRVLNAKPQIPASTTMYLDGDLPLQRLLPMYDADNDVIEFTLLNGPTKGQLTISDDAFTYLPDNSFTGEDSFTYRATELYSGESFDATVVITTKPQRYLLPKQKLVNNYGVNTTQFLLDYSGQLWAWGVNSWQLFNSNPSLSVTQATPFALYSPEWADISISDTNALLIHQDGSLWQLGYDSLQERSNINSPKRIGNSNDWLAALGTGNGNAHCQLLLKLDGSLWAMGSCDILSEAGLIEHYLSAQYEPLQIGAQYHWVSGKLSRYDAALLDNQGQVWTGTLQNWTAQYSGRETEAAFFAPVTTLPSPALDVHPAIYRSFALTEQGLYAWGSLPANAPWQWDNFNDESTGGAIALDTPEIHQLSAAGPFLLMLDNDSALWTAGGDINVESPGALGRGNNANRGLAKVDFADKWIQIFSGYAVSYGLSEKGQLLISGQYDLSRGTYTLDDSMRISIFTSIAQFDLTQLGYTDTDADGILDYLEIDADNDGLPDGWELMYALDRQNAADSELDNDNDGLSTLREFELGTNPTKADSDDDTMPDGWEIQYGLNPLDGADAISDKDNDDITALQEYKNGTHPNVSNKVTPPPAETSSAGGSMPATSILLLFAIAMYRRRYIANKQKGS